MKKFKFVAVVLTLVMCFTMFAGCGSSDSANTDTNTDTTDGDTIKIGFIGPLSGSTAMYGEAVCYGAKIYFDELNEQGGINGKQVEYITYDSKGDPTEATNAYTRLVDEDGVVAIVGPVLTGETLAVAQLAAEDGVPVVTASATGDSITDIGDTLFRTCFKDSFQGTKMADYCGQVLSYTNVAILYNNADEYSVGLTDAFRAEAANAGVTVVAEESYASGDTDFKSQLTNIKNSGAQAIFFPFYYDECYLAMQQAKEVGVDVPFLGGDGLSGLTTIADVDTTVIEGAIYSDHFSADGGNDATAEFKATYESLYGVTPMGFAYLACDAAMVIAEAVKNAASTDYADVVEAMKAVDMDCLTGHYVFDEDNNPIKEAAMTKVENGENVFIEMF